MEDIIKTVESLEDSGLLPEGVSEAIQNEANERNGGVLSMLPGILGASLLGNILEGKGINRAEEGVIAKRQGRGIVKADYRNKNCQKATTKRQGHKNKMDF